MSSHREEALLPGTIVAGYNIERELGRGNMAIVYLATQLNLERPVALKILTERLAQDEDYVLRFLNEAKAAAALSYPNIIQAYDAGAAEGDIYYFAMEYVDGENLDQRLLREGNFPLPESLGIGLDIAKALEYGWRKQGLTHGDIKPENIMQNAERVTKLADFGLAKITGHQYSVEGSMLTPLYGAPEVIQGKHKAGDCRADIYSFGATLYHMLCGMPPFPGEDAQKVMDRHVSEPLTPAVKRNPELPQNVSDFVGELLSKSPDDRPDTWKNVAERISDLKRSSQSQKHGKRTFRVRRDGRTTSMPPREPPEEQEDASPPPRQRDLGELLTTLTGIVLGVIMLLIAYHLGFVPRIKRAPAGQQDNTPRPAVTTKKIPVKPKPADPEKAAAEKEALDAWQGLQKRLKKAKDDDERLKMLTEFRRVHWHATPTAALAMLRELREKAKETEKAKKEEAPPKPPAVPSDPNKPAVWEDAEDRSTEGWNVYDTRGGPGSIENVPDPENAKNRAIKLQGKGLTNGFEYRFGTGETLRFGVSWRMRFSERYVIYVLCETDKGKRYVTLTADTPAEAKDDNEVRFGLGDDSEIGVWFQVKRDIRKDLRSGHPDCKLIRLVALQVRGSGLVDDITTFPHDKSTPVAEDWR